MEYFIAFLEGIITFISPCLLPMLPIYVSYFAGGKEGGNKKIIKNAIGITLYCSITIISCKKLQIGLIWKKDLFFHICSFSERWI